MKFNIPAKQLGLLFFMGIWHSVMAQMQIFEEPKSPRIANYRIEVRLDADTKRLQAKEMILWHNKTDVSAEDLRFHLYLNGFRNSQSTFMKESGGTHRGNRIDPSGWGFSEISVLKVLPTDLGSTIQFSQPGDHPDPDTMEDLTSAMTFLQPDDGNEADKTYMMVPLGEAITPGGSVWIYLEYDAKLPEPPFARTGAKEEFFFVAQWFPKIAVFEEGAWTDHQFHLNTEFYADFGVYDVMMTVPGNHILGATGLEVSVTDNPDGTKTHYYHAEDVHDFAWTSSSDFLEFKGQAQDVAIRALVQKDHAAQGQRHIDAAAFSIEYFQNWYGDYPFPNLTVLDPRRGAGGAGGMEYPTLITAGTYYRMPMGLRALELVILHEFGHNYFYHLLASNEFEESWMDEGINTYTEIQIMQDKFGKQANILDLLGLKVDIEQVHRAQYKSNPDSDPTVQDGWTFFSTGSYGINSYSKPGLILTTLQKYLGDQVMKDIMRNYVARFSFKHPKTRDFIDVANEISGQDLNWFFDQALFSRRVLDYSVHSIRSVKKTKPRGFDFDLSHEEEIPTATGSKGLESDTLDGYRNVVKIRRLGEFTFPVQVHFTFSDGSEKLEEWDGTDLWKRFEFDSTHPLVSAAVDPEYKIPLDINYLNNSLRRKPDPAPTRRFFSGWLPRIQSLLDFVSL